MTSCGVCCSELSRGVESGIKVIGPFLLRGACFLGMRLSRYRGTHPLRSWRLNAIVAHVKALLIRRHCRVAVLHGDEVELRNCKNRKELGRTRKNPKELHPWTPPDPNQFPPGDENVTKLQRLTSHLCGFGTCRGFASIPSRLTLVAPFCVVRSPRFMNGPDPWLSNPACDRLVVSVDLPMWL